MSVWVRYWLFQIPDLLLWGAVAGLLAWFEILPWRWVPLALVACGVKNAVLYPWVRQGYVSDPSRYVGPERLLESRGVVSEALVPQGYVWISGELWLAEAEGGRPLTEGTVVRVEAVHGLRLVVSPEPDPPVLGTGRQGTGGSREADRLAGPGPATRDSD